MNPEAVGTIGHAALAPVAGSSADAAALTDQARLAVVLQACALLAHLRQGGWRITGEWSDGTIDANGMLRSLVAEPGGDPRLPQVLLRRLLLTLFGGEREIAGRGTARRVARGLLESWRQELTPVIPDRAVAEILDAAPFLWQPTFGAARTALAAAHARGDGVTLWVAGPGSFRRALLATAETLEELHGCLAGDCARDYFVRSTPAGGVSDARQLAELGHWRRAARMWARQPPQASAQKIDAARTLYALGRFESAVDQLKGLRSAEARAVRVAAKYQLGELGAAKRGLRALAAARLPCAAAVELANTAQRVLAATDEPGAAAAWVQRALEIDEPEVRSRALIVAALAAWDRSDIDAMSGYLAEAVGVRMHRRVAWRWHWAEGLRRLASEDAPGAVDSMQRALRVDRRRLRPIDAAALWNDLALARAGAGDLAAAERGFRHAFRLMERFEGPKRTTLALCNLAEVRLRRGRLTGVVDILERSVAENRRAGNWRGTVHDTALWARYELVRGRPAAALARVREAEEELARRGQTWYSGELATFAARALGWMGRSGEAHEELERQVDAPRSDLEPEELPALWMLAGDGERALRECPSGAIGDLWRAVLLGQRVETAAWSALDGLGPYRAARCVYDFERVASGTAPQGLLRRAAESLRRVDAESMAERLVGGRAEAWSALEVYLGGEGADGDRLRELFGAAGYHDVRLSWLGDDGEQLLIDGPGGDERISAALDAGWLILDAPQLDATLRSLFAIARRDIRPADGKPRQPVLSNTGLVGESPALHASLKRLMKLARLDLPVLILGETGTGKELAAHAMHRASGRAGRPFLPINCAAALSEQLLMSDLFGHVRGAFTGADRDRAGLFEAARGGTVFLDEIGDLPSSAQGMLLRVFQEGEVRRVGESVARRVDVRVVAATHRDLDEGVGTGWFRQDLFYRLKVGSVTLPPLRERGGDVLLLADFFLARSSRSDLVLSAEARARIQAHPWPGNVRELESALQVAAAMTDGRVIEEADLELAGGTARRAPAGGYHERVQSFRRRLVEEALAASEGNRAEAARRLGLTRQALSYLVRQLRIDLP